MITTTIPTNLNFPNRGVLERDDFVNAQETAQDLLAGVYTTALNQYATELNDTEADINLKWEQVKSQAVTGGYSQAYIDATFTPKVLNTQTDKTTPVDADLIPLSDSASSFGLKKLSWANIKATLISSFGSLINGLTAKTTPIDADMIVIADSASSDASKKVTFTDLKTFLFGSPALTGTPTAPTQTAGDSSTKIATTAFVLENQQNAPNYNVAVSRLYNTVYQATNSCLLVVKFSGTFMNGLTVLVGSTSNPNTETALVGDDINSNTKFGTFHIPIKAGVYFKVAPYGPSGFESITITTYDYV